MMQSNLYILSKEKILNLILKSKQIKICIALSGPNDDIENILCETINDFSLSPDGTLELWHNNGYEI